MSALYFTTPTGEVELAGPERHWLLHLAAGPARVAWNLDHADMRTQLDQCERIISLIAERPGPTGEPDYLRDLLRQAQEELEETHRWSRRCRPGQPPPPRSWSDEPIRQLTDALCRRLVGVTADDTVFEVAGTTLRAVNVQANTALAAGADHIKLATKLAAWASCIIDGPHRAWIADLIDTGLAGGGFRDGVGWDKIAAMLRESDTEPVVTSHSTGDGFPSAYLAGMYPPMPDGIGPDDWEAYDRLPAEVRDARDEAIAAADEQWDELDRQEQFTRALAGLRTRRPWCVLTPDTLASVTIGTAVTVYDLLASDRDQRVAAAVRKETAR